MKADARDEAGRGVLCVGKGAYGKAGWKSGSTPFCCSKLLGQLAAIFGQAELASHFMFARFLP